MSSSSHSADESVDVTIDVWGVLTRRYSIILLGLVLGVTLAVLYCFKTRPLFESTTQILVMKNDTNLPVKAADSNAGVVEAGMAEDILATHTQIMSSPLIIGRALAKCGTAKTQELMSVLDEDTSPIDYVIENLEITRGGMGHASDAHVLNVRFVHVDQEEAFWILGAVVESYQAFVDEKFQDQSSEAVELITRAKDELAWDLRQKERVYREFRKSTRLVWQGDEVFNSHQIRLVEIERSISENRLRHAQVKSRLHTVELALNDPDAGPITDLERMALIDQADINRLGLLVTVERGDPISEAFQASQPVRQETASAEVDKLVDLRLQRNSLLLDHGANHPKVRELDQQILELANYLADQEAKLGKIEDLEELNIPQLMGAYVRLLRHDLTELDRRHQEMRDLADQESLESKLLVGQELRGQSLQNEVARTQALYNAVIDRLGEINLIKDYGGFITEVIEPVEIGESCWPKIPLIVALGCLLGLVVGCTGAAGVDLLDRSFRSPEEIGRALGLPVLTHVPVLTPLTSRITQKLKGMQRQNVRVSPDVVTHYLPKSRESEAFRGLRTSVLLRARTTRAQVIQVMSPTPGDGKTTLATNLAPSLAQTGKRVLLVDADMRRPNVHEAFLEANEVGLSSVLAGQVEWKEAVQETAVDNLAVLTCGPVPDNPSELLTSPIFEELIAALRDEFEFVIVDSPPVLAVSDPITIASQADVAILQIRVTDNGKPAAMKCRELITATGVNILGIAVSGAEENKDYGYGYYGYLGYGYDTYANRNGEYFQNGHHPKKVSQS